MKAQQFISLLSSEVRVGTNTIEIDFCWFFLENVFMDSLQPEVWTVLDLRWFQLL